MQLSPIFSFQHLTGDLYISGGNFFDVIPYEGQYDAQALAMFTVNGDSITCLPPSKVPSIKGQVRDVKLINKDLLIVSRNNDSLVTYRYNYK